MKTGNSSSPVSSARSDQGCSHASEPLVQGAGRPEQEGTWRGSSAGHLMASEPAIARPCSPPASKLRSSTSLPQVPKKTSSTNLKEHVMVSSIRLVKEHVTLTLFGVRTTTHEHEYELVEDILVSKPQSLDGSS
jgi:hypothetical protein